VTNTRTSASRPNYINDQGTALDPWTKFSIKGDVRIVRETLNAERASGGNT
jgi:hypothetical protein